MQIQPKPPTVKGSADRFIGDVWLDVVALGEAPSRIRVSIVRFSPGARNAWHAHAVGQTLHVTEGVGRIQSRGGEAIEIRAGDTIHAPPGEWHWHGAAPDHFMTHLAMWEAPDEGAESEWGELTTEAEYLSGEPMNAGRTDAIRALLLEAEEAHGVYETTTLNGVYDEQWARWYAGYVVDHGIGDLVGVSVSADGVARQLDDGFAEYQLLEPKPGESWADHLARKIAAEAEAT